MRATMAFLMRCRTHPGDGLATPEPPWERGPQTGGAAQPWLWLWRLHVLFNPFFLRMRHAPHIPPCASLRSQRSRQSSAPTKLGQGKNKWRGRISLSRHLSTMTSIEVSRYNMLIWQGRSSLSAYNILSLQGRSSLSCQAVHHIKTNEQTHSRPGQ